MRKQNSDGPSISLASARDLKDKRALVLFLFGLLLLLSHGPSLIYRWNPGSFDEKRESEGQGTILQSLAPVSSLSPKGQPSVSEKMFANGVPAELSLFVNKPLPINRVGNATLQMLPGVGPHLADAMVQERQRQGKFSAPEDLLRVSGIGRTNLQKLQSLISFE